MTPEQLAKEIHALRDEENDSSDNGTYPRAGMPEGYRKNWTRVAQSLLDKYTIEAKAQNKCRICQSPTNMSVCEQCVTEVTEAEGGGNER